jgi:hypothetical protein
MGMGMATRGASPELVRERASRATSPRGGVDSLEDFWLCNSHSRALQLWVRGLYLPYPKVERYGILLYDTPRPPAHVSL